MILYKFIYEVLQNEEISNNAFGIENKCSVFIFVIFDIIIMKMILFNLCICIHCIHYEKFNLKKIFARKLCRSINRN